MVKVIWAGHYSHLHLAWCVTCWKSFSGIELNQKSSLNPGVALEGFRVFIFIFIIAFKSKCRLKFSIQGRADRPWDAGIASLTLNLATAWESLCCVRHPLIVMSRSHPASRIRFIFRLPSWSKSMTRIPQGTEPFYILWVRVSQTLNQPWPKSLWDCRKCFGNALQVRLYTRKTYSKLLQKKTRGKPWEWLRSSRHDLDTHRIQHRISINCTHHDYVLLIHCIPLSRKVGHQSLQIIRKWTEPAWCSG